MNEYEIQIIFYIKCKFSIKYGKNKFSIVCYIKIQYKSNGISDILGIESYIDRCINRFESILCKLHRYVWSIMLISEYQGKIFET